MIGKKSTHLFRHLLFIVLAVFSWEFTFPYHAAAQEIESDIKTIVEKQYINPQLITAIEFRLPQIPDKPQLPAKKTLKIAVTAYSSTPDQTSGDPFITASGTRVHDGTLAANFLPIGTKVRFPEKFGNKIFVVEDRMAARYWHRADIWMPTRQAAKEWGVRHIKMEIL